MILQTINKPGEHRPTGWRRWLIATALVVVTVTPGCASPPSVVPLLEQVHHVLADQQQDLQQRAEQDAVRFDQQRQMLQQAYEADLTARPQLDADWVRDGTAAYVTALEAMLRHELQLTDQLRTRGRNLELAADAQRRAIRLIQRQDELLERLPDLRRWIDQPLTSNHATEIRP